jgi:hypothetical protein
LPEQTDAAGNISATSAALNVTPVALPSPPVGLILVAASDIPGHGMLNNKPSTPTKDR